DRAYAGATIDEIFPGFRNRIADRGDAPQAGHDNSATGQCSLRTELLLQMGVDVVNRLLDVGDLLGFLVGNFALELLFQRHHQLDGIERIRAEIVDKRGLVLDLRLVDAKLLGNDLLDALFDVLHGETPSLKYRNMR